MNLKLPTMAEATAFYISAIVGAAEKGHQTIVEQHLAKTDLFFLLVYVLNRKDLCREWLYQRCREVEAEPDGYLDLWAREHGKSSLITFGLTIQDILKDPELTVGIFSFNRPTAKAFLRQIKNVFETNEKLKALFPDVLWQNPTSEAPTWSEDNGIVVKRSGSVKEATIEAYGLIDGQPTSKHYRLMVYDDVVTRESVSTPDMIRKVTEAWELSRNLTTDGGRTRYIGTRYSHNDTYRTIIDRKAAIERRHAVTYDGTVDGEPVLWTKEKVAEKRREQGPYTFCLPGDAPILMGDGSEKRIDLIQPGDKIVGYTISEAPERGKYVPAEVLRVSVIDGARVLCYVTEDGDEVFCTEDHKWFTGRIDVKAGRSLYSHIGLSDRYDGIKKLERMYQRRECRDPDRALWLGGIFDGEGTVSGSTIQISQSPEHNPEVCDAIDTALKILGFQYGTHERAAGEYGGRNHKLGRSYYMSDGRQGLLDFVKWCRPVKAQRIMDRIVMNCGRRSTPIKVTDVFEAGKMPVYGIETTTGNYIAYGYLSKNSSQMLLDPTSDRTHGFRDEWLRYYDSNGDHNHMNKYICVDAASSKKRESDYTAMAVIGLSGDQNFYLLDAVRDRMSLTERGNAVFELHKRWKPKGVAYEKYGQMSDIEYLKERMQRENYRFEIEEVGGQMSKHDRIRRMVPIFETGRFYLPETLIKIDYEGRHVDITRAFVDEEFRPFPVGLHEDLFDAISRIWDIGHVWPKEYSRNVDRYARPRLRRVGNVTYMAA